MVENHTTIVVKDEDGLFVLQFAYQLRVPIDIVESSVKLTSWTIECILAQGGYVMVD